MLDLDEDNEYADWKKANPHIPDSEGLLEAAIACGVPADRINETYQGHYESTADFAEALTRDLGYLSNLGFLVIDWQATWDCNLRHDYSEHEGHIFLQNY